MAELFTLANQKLCYFQNYKILIGWLVLLRFNATFIAKVISWRLEIPSFPTPLLTQISFQSHRLLFSHASAEVRGENTLERNLASTGSQTHNQQVMSLTPSSLSHQDRATKSCRIRQRMFSRMTGKFGSRLFFTVLIWNPLSHNPDF